MRQQHVVFHLAWIGLLFLAAAGGSATTGSPIGVAPAETVVSMPDSGPADVPATDDFTPVACRMEPQCSTNADCVAWCGPTGGHCVHNSCPTRICKCS
jgi:hypothetical protein